MTKLYSADVKEVHFMSDSVRAMLKDPKIVEILDQVENAISQVQNKKRLTDAKNRTLSSELPGIAELRFNSNGSAIRIYHAFEFKEVMVVLDIVDKKSNTGSDLPLSDKRRLLTRLKEFRAHYEANKEGYVARFKERERRMTSFERKQEVKRYGT